jgi:hypothetical protein
MAPQDSHKAKKGHGETEDHEENHLLTRLNCYRYCCQQRSKEKQFNHTYFACAGSQDLMGNSNILPSSILPPAASTSSDTPEIGIADKLL